MVESLDIIRHIRIILTEDRLDSLGDRFVEVKSFLVVNVDAVTIEMIILGIDNHHRVIEVIFVYRIV